MTTKSSSGGQDTVHVPSSTPWGAPDGSAARRGTLNHVRLTVTDVGVAEPFYALIADHFGLELVERDEQRLAWAAPLNGDSLQWLILANAHADALHDRHDRYSPGLQHIAFNVESRDGVDELYRSALAADISVERAPEEYDYEEGYYAVFLRDPDGIVIEAVHVPVQGSRTYWSSFESSQKPV